MPAAMTTAIQATASGGCVVQVGIDRRDRQPTSQSALRLAQKWICSTPSALTGEIWGRSAWKLKPQRGGIDVSPLLAYATPSRDDRGQRCRRRRGQTESQKHEGASGDSADSQPPPGAQAGTQMRIVGAASSCSLLASGEFCVPYINDNVLSHCRFSSKLATSVAIAVANRTLSC